MSPLALEPKATGTRTHTHRHTHTHTHTHTYTRAYPAEPQLLRNPRAFHVHLDL